MGFFIFARFVAILGKETVNIKIVKRVAVNTD